MFCINEEPVKKDPPKRGIHFIIYKFMKCVNKVTKEGLPITKNTSRCSLMLSISNAAFKSIFIEISKLASVTFKWECFLLSDILGVPP